MITPILFRGGVSGGGEPMDPWVAKVIVQIQEAAQLTDNNTKNDEIKRQVAPPPNTPPSPPDES